MRNPLLVSLLCVGLCACGGKPVEARDELTAMFAWATVPTAAARGAASRLYSAGVDSLPTPFITVKGASGGEATMKLNPVGVVVGLAGKGIMVDMEYKGFSEDGAHFLDGNVSALTQFDYVPATDEAAYADVKVGLVGQVNLSGVLRDALDLNVTLTTRFEDLSLAADKITYRIDGTVDTPVQQFAWHQEDLEVLWKEATAQK